MLLVLLPIALIIILVLAPIPKIGGEVRIALLLAALVAGIMGSVAPTDMAVAAVDGINMLAWVIGLAVFGSIYAQTQIKLGTMDTVLNIFRSLFGRTPKGLIAAVILTLVLSGSLLGDAIAAATVIGVLVVMALAELKLSPEQIGATILMGGILGSIMPPITQAIFLSAGLIGVEDPTQAVNLGYITVGLGVVVSVLWASTFIKIKSLPEELIPQRGAGQIIKEEWKRLIPLMILALMVIVRSLTYQIPILYDIVMGIDSGFVAIFGGIPILGGITFRVTQAIIIATIVSFFFKDVRSQMADTLKDGLKSVQKTAQIQVCAGVMVGMFYAAGVIERVVELAEGLSLQAVTLGGGASLGVLGMLTGSQTTAQNTIVPLMGPILTDTFGVSSTGTIIGASHIAAAGQTFPPVCLTAFVVVGIVGGIINKAVDPVKVMLLALPVTIYLIVVGFAAWFGYIG